jgi:hypothetical protein
MLETAVTILYKMGGAGFTRVVNHWLASSEPYARLEGIHAAFKRPDQDTVRLLEAISLTRYEDDVKWHPSLAGKSLAIAEAWKSAVKTIVFWHKDAHRDTIYARAGQGPLSDEEMAPALEALRDSPKHPGALMALGFGKRSEYVGHIARVLDEEKGDNDVSNACVWALSLLPKLTPEAVEALDRRLARPDGRWLVIQALLKDGSEQAARALLKFLTVELARDHYTILCKSPERQYLR